MGFLRHWIYVHSLDYTDAFHRKFIIMNWNIHLMRQFHFGYLLLPFFMCVCALGKFNIRKINRNSIVSTIWYVLKSNVSAICCYLCNICHSQRFFHIHIPFRFSCNNWLEVTMWPACYWIFTSSMKFVSPLTVSHTHFLLSFTQLTLSLLFSSSEIMTENGFRTDIVLEIQFIRCVYTTAATVASFSIDYNTQSKWMHDPEKSNKR